MYTSFQKNQLKIKLLEETSISFCKSINLNVNLFKLHTINDSILLEGLFLLEFFTGSKTFISYFKKNFKEINIQIANDLNSKNIFYFFSLLKIFYLPILYRRSILVEKDKIFNSNFNYTISNVNILNFLPDIYFRWNKSINCFFNFNNKTLKHILLFLYYLGFNFNQQVLIKEKY